MRRQPGDVPGAQIDPSPGRQFLRIGVVGILPACVDGRGPERQAGQPRGIPFGAQVDQPGGNAHGHPSVQQPGAGPCVDRLEISRSAQQAQSRCHRAGDVPFKATIALFSVGRISVAAVVLDETRTSDLEYGKGIQ